MDIIAKSVPVFDQNDMAASMQAFRDYMVETLELIDFTLSNQGTVVRGAVSEENFEILTQAVAALTSKVTAMEGTVSSVSGRVTEMGNNLSSLEEAVAANTNQLEEHENRIQALENKP